MRLGASRSQLYDAQKVARARWEGTAETWLDSARQDFDDQTWQPLDRAVADVLRSIDALSVLFNQIRQECEGQS